MERQPYEALTMLQIIIDEENLPIFVDECSGEIFEPDDEERSEEDRKKEARGSAGIQCPGCGARVTSPDGEKQCEYCGTLLQA